MNGIVRAWLKRCKDFSLGFAYIRTLNAVYDRVAIMDEHSTGMQIEYPVRYRSGYKIKKEFYDEGQSNYIELEMEREYQRGKADGWKEALTK